MPRTKSLATLIEHYGEERIYNPKLNKLPAIYKILNKHLIFYKWQVIYLI